MATIEFNAKEFESIVKKRLSAEKLKAAAVVGLKEMDKIKNRETRRFKSPVKGAEWDNTYNAKYAKSQGKRINAVNLRSNKPKTNSIQKTAIQPLRNGAVLKFQDKKKGVVFNYHQLGTATGCKKRVTFPRKVSEIPKEVISKIVEFLTK